MQDRSIDVSKYTTARPKVRCGKRGGGRGDFLWRWDIAASSLSSPIVVTDSRNHKVYFLDAELNVVSTFDNRRSEEGKLNGPYGVAINKENKVFIADR